MKYRKLKDADLEFLHYYIMPELMLDTNMPVDEILFHYYNALSKLDNQHVSCIEKCKTVKHKYSWNTADNDAA